VLLFGIPAYKDAVASSSYDRNGIVQRAIRAVKAELPGMLVMADLCGCEYTDHGHCGILDSDGEVDNDTTLETALPDRSDVRGCGADVVAPSDMMDGRVKAIRCALDGHGRTSVAIMAYSAKYASAFYGAVSRCCRFGTAARRSAVAIRWTRPTLVKRCARSRWTLRRAPTS